MQSEAPDYWNHSVKFCLFCNKEGHLTNECWSTHAINTPAQKELARLAYLASPSSQPAEKAEAVAVIGSGFQLLWTGPASFAEHARKHGLKVGSLLYAAPLTTAPEEWREEACKLVVDLYRDTQKLSGSQNAAERLLELLATPSPAAQAPASEQEANECESCLGTGRTDDPEECPCCGMAGCRSIDCPDCSGTGHTPPKAPSATEGEAP